MEIGGRVGGGKICLLKDSMIASRTREEGSPMFLIESVYTVQCTSLHITCKDLCPVRRQISM